MPTVIKLVKKNQKLHNSDLPFLVGEVNEPGYIDTQTTLF